VSPSTIIVAAACGAAVDPAVPAATSIYAGGRSSTRDNVVGGSGGGAGGVRGTAVGWNSKNLGALKAIDAATMTTTADRSRRRPTR